MKKHTSVKNNSNVFIVKNRYCISFENAGKRTAGASGYFSEAIFSAKTYCSR